MYLITKFRLVWDKRCGPILLIKFKSRTIGFAICHRRKDRSISIFGFTFPICARCTGIFMGFLIAIILYSFKVAFPIQIALLMIIPLIVDGITQTYGLRESNNSLRIITGIFFSLGLFSLIELIYIFFA